jgi:hypothetical protein
MELYKDLETEVTEELLKNLVEKYVDVTHNEIKGVEGNFWFGGMVAGYEVSINYFDTDKEEFRDKPYLVYSIVLTDGSAHILGKCKILTLTHDEFLNKLTDHIMECYTEETNG